jgi:hypothetical protein
MTFRGCNRWRRAVLTFLIALVWALIRYPATKTVCAQNRTHREASHGSHLAAHSLPSVARDVLGTASLCASRWQISACLHIVGQSFLARHALRQCARLTTSLVPDGPGGVEVCFDLVDHAVTSAATDGRRASFALGPMSVADFHGRFRDMIRSLGATAQFNGRPNEVPNPLPFAQDQTPRPYDTDAVTRFFNTIVAVDRVLKNFRTAYIGKVSPVHLFWGSFDLAVTRFSGRRAPAHPGGIPALPDEVTREAYSHEASSAGFWPGGGGVDFPAFYSYAYPAPDGFARASRSGRRVLSQDVGGVPPAL